MPRFHKGRYAVKNPDKFFGDKAPVFRSSWERDFMKFCDSHPNIFEWASEPIRIPYLHPATQRRAFYVPDFIVFYYDKAGNTRKDVVEIKPKCQTNINEAKTKKDKAAARINAAKWDAAREFCRRNGMGFRIITEEQIYRNPRTRVKNKPKAASQARAGAQARTARAPAQRRAPRKPMQARRASS